MILSLPWARMFYIMRTSLRHGARLLRDRVLRMGSGASMDGPNRLKAFVEDLGGSFLKFGQIMAIQPDIIPPAYCNALFDLMDRVPSFSMEKVRATILEELGKPHELIFDTFVEKPLATASIGQVHVAYLNGKKVAVKVQRPNALTDTLGDIRIMAATVALIKFLHIAPLYWMIDPMSEFLGWTLEELDYRNEARYMNQVGENGKGKTTEKVPEIYWEYTTPRVLVLEFLEGVTILDYMRAKDQGDEVTLARLESMGFDLSAFSRNIILNFLGGSFNFGLFHADLHPANLMILPQNVVGYVDFGITGVLSRYSREALVSLTLAYTRADIDKMTDIFLSVSTLGANADPAGLKAGLLRGAAEWYERRPEGVRMKTSITLVMLDMLMVSKAVDIWPERDVIKYIRSAIALDGLINRFAPGYNVGATLEEICNRYLKWGARQKLFSYDRLLGSALDGGRLVLHGPTRAQALLDYSLNASSVPTSPQPVRPRRDASATIPMLAFFILFTSLLLTFSPGPLVLGYNLFSAELLLLGVSLMLFIGVTRRATAN